MFTMGLVSCRTHVPAGRMQDTFWAVATWPSKPTVLGFGRCVTNSISASICARLWYTRLVYTNRFVDRTRPLS
jgi:hypothetical protein